MKPVYKSSLNRIGKNGAKKKQMKGKNRANRTVKTLKRNARLEDEEENYDGSDVNMSSDEDESLSEKLGKAMNHKQLKAKNKDKTTVKVSKNDEEMDEEGSNGSFDESMESQEDQSESENLEESMKHKKSLSKLKETDPEFYNFLQENDRKLLQFNASDSENESSSEEDEEKFHKTPDKLEVDSEESDYEDSTTPHIPGSVITLAMVNSWRQMLTENPDMKGIMLAVKGFNAALDRVTGEESSELKVDGSAVFNAIVELCVMHLQPAIVKFLKLTPGTLKNPEKSKKWAKVKNVLRSYFTDLLKLLIGVSSEHILSVLLKHLHTACPLVASFGKLSKLALKRLAKLWSSGEETVRVLAFLCILKLCTSQKSGLLNLSLKLLYIDYIKSSNFVSVNTLAQINFMRRSLASLFTLDPILSYQHAFLYIRQLAIHLRNAVTIHKKESFQSVYNWQYMQSLRLWVDLMCGSKDNPDLQQLLYPLVQIIIGCIKLVPTAQYAPLRFHCIKLLIKLEMETNIYVPTLPFIIESLAWIDLNKQHKKVTMKPFDFTCVLRLSKAAMTENGFKDAIIENVYSLLLEATASYSCNITYPDIIIPALYQLRSFLKDCKVSKYTSKLKQLLSKMEENSKFINNERNKLSLNLSDPEKIRALESKIQVQGTPLMKFWEQWNRVNAVKVAKKATNNQKLGDYNIPKIIKKGAKVKPEEKEDDGQVVLFPSDDESDGESPKFGNVEIDTRNEETKENKQQKRKKKKKEKTQPDEEIEAFDNIEGQEDTVEDLNFKTF